MIEFFVFSVEDFEVLKFYENEAKREKLNFKRGLSVAFMVKNAKIFENRLKTLQAYFFKFTIFFENKQNNKTREM